MLEGLKERIRIVRTLLWSRRGAYRATFRAPSAHLVMRDLARFCNAHSSTFSADAREHAVMEGRREVWLRIQEHLHLPDEELWSLYSGRGSADE